MPVPGPRVSRRSRPSYGSRPDSRRAPTTLVSPPPRGTGAQSHPRASFLPIASPSVLLSCLSPTPSVVEVGLDLRLPPDPLRNSTPRPVPRLPRSGPCRPSWCVRVGHSPQMSGVEQGSLVGERKALGRMDTAVLSHHRVGSSHPRLSPWTRTPEGSSGREGSEDGRAGGRPRGSGYEPRPVTG